jgi:polysaccharide biosynthesis/export protein
MLNRQSSKLRTIVYGIYVSASLALTGCTQIQRPDEGAHESLTSIEYSIPNDEYRLQAGDRVNMIVLAKPNPEQYRLTPGDEIEVHVEDRDDLSTNYIIGADMQLQFRQLASLSVQNKTLDDLKRIAATGYREQGIQGHVSLNFKRYNAAVVEFIRSLSQTEMQSNPYKTTLERDGRANFPLIGPVNIEGKTLIEANELISEKFSRLMQNIDVTLRMEDSLRRTITIIGAVTQPGAYPLYGSASLLSIIGTAKGYTDEARTGSIITIQPRTDKIYVNKIDLEEDILRASTLQMAPGDIIYVPKKIISDVNRFVDQYFRKNIPLLMNLPINTIL